MSTLDLVLAAAFTALLLAWLYVMVRGALDMTSRQRRQWHEDQGRIVAAPAVSPEEKP